MLVVDPEGTIRQSNPRVAQLLGRLPAGRRPLLADYSPEIARMMQAWRREPQSTLAPFLAPRSGAELAVHFIAIGTGDPPPTVVFVEDVGRLREQAQQMKLVALGRLTASIAHEIRNPLSSINHAAELLSESERSQAGDERFLKIIRDNVHRLDRIVQEVLYLNRRDRAKAEAIEPRAFLEQFAADFCMTEKVPADAVWAEVRTSQRVSFDRQHLHQVLWNLLRNAWRHGHEAAGVDAPDPGARGHAGHVHPRRGQRRAAGARRAPGASLRAVLHHRSAGNGPGPLHRARALRRQRRAHRVPRGRHRLPLSHHAERRRMSTKAVLVVDDESDIRELLVVTLSRMGVDAEGASSVAEAKQALERRAFDLALTDMRLPDGEGLDVLRHIAEHYGNTPVAVITAYGSTENAVAALKAGAFDYLSKPIKLEQLRPLVMSALKLPKHPQSRRVAVGETAQPGAPQLIGESAPIQRAREMIAKLARSQAPVYITGESGTGKEVAARLIHAGSARADAPFIAVNCGAIPENLMESEFFGYRKGAFTGAEADRAGYLHAAQKGTLFLDEVGDLPLAMQVKLLRVIQEKKFRRLGDTVEEAVDMRIISATHRSLSEQVSAGEFRQDLFYRLNVIEMRMPALREIPDDIAPMVAKLVERLARQNALAPPTITEEALLALRRYDFPGNVRELENILERALALCSDNSVRESDLYLTQVAPKDKAVALDGALGTRGLPLHDFLDQVEREVIQKALETTRFNKTAAAKLLGITFRSLRYRLDRLGID